MTIICCRCLKILDVPDPPGYEDMDIIDKLNAHSGLDHAICRDCIKELLIKEEDDAIH